LIDEINYKNEVELLSKYLVKIVGSPIFIDGNMFHVTHSSGIVLYPENGHDFNELLKNADTAMYKSKECGRGMYSFYHAEMGEAAGFIILKDMNMQ
jgi:diguanylate cyclase (GGDEF)-like protein